MCVCSRENVTLVKDSKNQLSSQNTGVYESRQQALDANPGETVIVRGYNSFSAAKRAAKSRQGGYHNFVDDLDTDKSEEESEDEALDW